MPSAGFGGVAVASSTPVRVTGWAVCHAAASKVRVVGRTVPSAVLSLARPRTTVAVGAVASRTVKVAVPPDSVVRSPVVGTIVRPGVGVTGTGPVSTSSLPVWAAARTRTRRVRAVSKFVPP